MTDIALAFDPISMLADITIDGGSLATDEGLLTAVIVSLFTDRRARVDDVLPDANGDRRGWWGDCFNDDSADRIGSRLWLLEREKLLPATALKARDICAEALAWFIDDGVLAAIDVQTAIVPVSAADPSGALAIYIPFVRPDGRKGRLDFAWDATARSFRAL